MRVTAGNRWRIVDTGNNDLCRVGIRRKRSCSPGTSSRCKAGRSIRRSGSRSLIPGFVSERRCLAVAAVRDVTDLGGRSNQQCIGRSHCTECVPSRSVGRILPSAVAGFGCNRESADCTRIAAHGGRRASAQCPRKQSISIDPLRAICE